MYKYYAGLEWQNDGLMKEHMQVLPVVCNKVTPNYLHFPLDRLAQFRCFGYRCTVLLVLEFALVELFVTQLLLALLLLALTSMCRVVEDQQNHSLTLKQ